ncbi:hypothetical protein RJ035_005933, partial [Blastomyces gilchristii]
MPRNKNGRGKTQKKLQLSKLNKSKFSMKKRKDILLRELNRNRFKRMLRKGQLLSTQLKRRIFNKKWKKELLLSRRIKTAAETHTSQPVTQLNFASFMPIKGDDAHSIIDPASTELKDVSTSARMVMIIFKAHEQGKWVNTYKMTINPSELSDLSM